MEAKMNELHTYSFWKNQKSLLWQATPLLLLVLTSVLLQNTVSIVLILAMVISFDSMNHFITQLSERCKVSFLEIFVSAAYLICCTALSYPVLESVWLFMLPDLKEWYDNSKSFWLSLFQVTVLDYMCKFLTMFFKCSILWCCTRFNYMHIRGKVLSVCEGVSQVCRCLLPIPEWTKYMIISYSTVPTIFCWFIAFCYIILKIRSLKSKLGIITKTFESTITTLTDITDIQAGTVDEGIERLDDLKCPLCHEKCKYPVQIACKHSYCKACISVWSDREQQCPYCLSANVNAIILGLQQTIHPPMEQFSCINLKWKTGATDSVIQFF